MKHTPHPTIIRTVLSLALVASGIGAAQAAVSVCVDTSSPTVAMDKAIAAAVAKQQKTTLTVHEFDGSGDDEGFDLKEFNAMASKDCQLVMGFPVDASASGLPEGLKATDAYGRTGFVLVTPVAAPSHSLSTLPEGSQVAVTYQTTPNLYFANYPKLQADVHLTNDDAIAALEQKKVGAAMLWRPSVVGYLAQHQEEKQFDYAELDEPHSRWNLVALYDQSNAAAAQAFDASVKALQANGALGKLLDPYAVVAGNTGASKGQANAITLSMLQRGAQLASNATGAPKAEPAAAGGAVAKLYTSAQADRGKTDYADNCALCHGDTLAGRAGPALKGKHFANPAANFHVGDIFTIVSQNMPATQPASLDPKMYADIMAFLLQENGFPAGDKELTFDDAKASKEPLVYHGTEQ
ncbi:Cytochrome C oxidase, cbb3-type, subunit III [Pseudoxanthomonas sp. GM95]|uniref:c-type cytochrome n=1 Tax=Pseudoxanthomonas sp. GM95 TaxID=1881043 RepID=UPI0008D03B73|nr:c-type cytochrome [Pseudoxanthomonas sp. GM95]SEM23933.1 Cytochrome C oxidase, cbb3-type, subunit III [Pseudoxanthomonas sp. GM95]